VIKAMLKAGINGGVLHRLQIEHRELPMAHTISACLSPGVTVRPKCVDLLPFASEGVLSEVADMYPAY
jgi:hypothetical protein